MDIKGIECNASMICIVAVVLIYEVIFVDHFLIDYTAEFYPPVVFSKVIGKWKDDIIDAGQAVILITAHILFLRCRYLEFRIKNLTYFSKHSFLSAEMLIL